MTRATAADILPTVTRLTGLPFFCSIFGAKYALKMSMVKMVEAELSIEANEEMMAAAKAANTSPLRPTGMRSKQRKSRSRPRSNSLRIA